MGEVLPGKNSTNNKKSDKTTDLGKLKPKCNAYFTFNVQNLNFSFDECPKNKLKQKYVIISEPSIG